MNRPLLTLLAFHALDKLLFFSIAPNKPISAWQAGWLDDSAALFFVIQIFCYRLFPLLGGFLADRYSKRSTLAFGSLLQALGLAALCQATSSQALFFAGGLVGIGGAPESGHLFDAEPGIRPGRQPRFSTHYLLINVGALAGPLLLWPAFGNACLWLLLPAGVAMVTVLASSAGSRAIPAPHRSASWFAPLHDPIFLRVFILFSAIWACYTMIFSSAPDCSRTRVTHARQRLAGREFGHGPARLPVDAAPPGKDRYLLAQCVGRTRADHHRRRAGGNSTRRLDGRRGHSRVEHRRTPVDPGALPPGFEHAPAHARSRYFGFIWVAGAFGEAGAQALLWACPQPRAICIVAAAMLAIATLTTTRKVKVRAAEINATESRELSTSQRAT